MTTDRRLVRAMLRATYNTYEWMLWVLVVGLMDGLMGVFSGYLAEIDSR